MRDEQTAASLVYLCGIVAVASVYCFARWWNLDSSCLGFDEIFSVHAATHGWRDMFRFVALDLIHPPLFYALLKIWIAAGGESLVWLRLFPVAWSVLAIVPLLLLCRELNLSRVETLTAFAFVATNGALIRYAQEVRMYAVVLCLALFSLWLFAKFLNSSSITIFAALFVVNLLLVYTHYFGWLLIATELAVVYLIRGEKIVRFLISTGVLLSCFAAWILVVGRVAFSEENLAQNIGWQTRPGLVVFSQFWLTLSEPFYYRQSSADASNFLPVALPVWLIIAIASILHFKKLEIGKLLTRRTFSFHAIRTRFDAEPSWLLLYFAFAPVAFAFVASWLMPYSVWGTRHLIIVFVPFALLASVSLWRVPNRKLKTAALVSLAALLFVSACLHFTRAPQTFIWCGWGNLVERADEFKFDEPSVVYVFEDDAAYHLWYRLKGNPRVRIVSVDGYTDMPEDAAYFLPRSFGEVIVISRAQLMDKDVIEGEKFWLAFRDRSPQPDKQVLRELAARGFHIGQTLVFRAQGESALLIQVGRRKDEGGSLRGHAYGMKE